MTTKPTKMLLFIAVLIFPFAASAADSNVRINSIGFLPNNAKGFTCNVSATNFDVVRVSDSAVVYSGTLGGAVAAADSGETVYRGDFSSFTTPGTYRVTVTGVGNSVNFTIDNAVYNSPFVAVTRAMYLWRCNTAVSGTYTYNSVTNTYSHAACHMNDGYLDYFTGSTALKDGQRGWHDAGDYNKYIVNAGAAVGPMFMAWEHFGAKINSLALNLPETAAGYPEYLKEMKWETDWVLKMTHPDGSGRVSWKLSALNFDAFEMPEAENEARYYTRYGTASTADFVAMLAMAARIFYPYDPAYSLTCITAARVSYNWLLANTADYDPSGDNTADGFQTGGYGTSDPDDRLWAAAEMWATTGDADAHADFQTRANAYTDKTDADWDWSNMKNLGMYTYLLCTRTGKNATILADIQTDLLADANAATLTSINHGYGRNLGTNYYWGCNGSVARQVMLFQIANMISPQPNYVTASLNAIGYLFGRNMHRRSYVTSVGASAPMYPHDRRSGADGIANPWPGYLVGGSPGSRQDPVLTLTPAGLPAAVYWTDQQGSYASNEIAINWQGAIVYALAAFIGTSGTPTFTPTVTRTITGTPPTATVTPTNSPIVVPGVVQAECVQGSTFTINGNLNEAAWASGSWTSITRTVEGTQGAVSASYKVKWDNTYFYVGVQVTDGTLCNTNTDWYNDDSVEIYLDMNHNAGTTYDAYDYQLAIRYGVATLIVNPTGQTSGFTASTAVIAGGYAAEFRIPWADSGVTPSTGLSFGFDVGVNHDETCGGTRTGVLMWNGTANNYTNTSAFGDAVLQACAAVSPTFTGTRTPTRTVTRTRTAGPSPTFTRTPTVTPTFTATEPVSGSIIDNFEDGNDQVLLSEGRNGYWFTFDDGTGILSFLTDDAPHSGTYGASMYFDGFTAYAGVSANMLSPEGPYNASSYDGIRFWARIDAGSDTYMRVNITDEATRADYDYFGVWLTTLSTTWQEFIIPFSSLTQEAGGTLPAVDETTVYSIEFRPYIGYTLSVHIDDISFYGSSPVPTNTRTATRTITQTHTATRTATRTATGSATASVTQTHTRTMTRTNTQVITATDTPADTFTFTRTVTPTATRTGTQTNTPTATRTVTGSATPTYTRTVTRTNTPVYSPTETNTGTPPTDTITPTVSQTYTATPTYTATGTFTRTVTETASPSVTVTDTTAQTSTPSASASPSPTFTRTATPGNTLTNTPVNTVTDTPADTVTNTPVDTASVTASVSPTFTYTRTRTNTPVNTVTRTMTRTATPTGTLYIAPTATLTPVIVPTPETYVISNTYMSPNPLNLTAGGSRYFTCDLTQDTQSIKIRVYTMAFRAIKEITINGPVQAGIGRTIIDNNAIEAIAAGVYYYTAEAESLNGERSKAAIGSFQVIK